MAAGNVSRTIRAPGRIVIDPTDLTAAYPYGGTEIGKSTQCALASLSAEFRVDYEALGEPGDVLEPGNYYAFSCFLRGHDDDAIAQCLTGTGTGTTSQHTTWSVPGDAVPGQSAYDSRKRIFLYVADDLIHVDSLLIYAGVPFWTEGAQIAFQRGSELGIPLTVLCMRDASNDVLTMRRFADMASLI